MVFSVGHAATDSCTHTAVHTHTHTHAHKHTLAMVHDLPCHIDSIAIESDAISSACEVLHANAALQSNDHVQRKCARRE